MSRVNPTSWSREDRDLLVELRTRLISVETGVQEMKTGVTSRLLNLEGNTVMKIEFKDHEDRIRHLEKYRWLVAGAITIIAVIAPYVIGALFNV